MRDEAKRTFARAAAFVGGVLGVIALLPALLLGDVIWVGTGTGRGFRQEVDIVGVEGDQLVYLVNGNRASSLLDRIQQIELAGDTGFTQAEEAFVSGDWEAASTNYLVAARRHAKEWVRRRAAARLITSAERAGRFDQAVTGFLHLTLVAPEAAVGREPVPPQEVEPIQLETAAAELQRALDEGVSPAQARPLLALLLNIHNRRGDELAAGATVERLGRVMGEDAAGHDPKLYAQVLLGRAELAMSRGQIPEAVRLVNEGRELFEEPRQQSQALMILARVAERQAGNDRARLMDAAVAYMKVVTFFKRQEGSPNVPEALLKVGQIHEKLNLPDAAADLYRDLVARYPDSPPAAEAQRRLDSLAG